MLSAADTARNSSGAAELPTARNREAKIVVQEGRADAPKIYP